MPHDTPLITTIVAGLVLAFIFGAIANRLKMPPLVGYLVAGVAVGPHSPGFVADQALASQLADIGVILLMFGVGLHFSLKDLLSVRAIAVPGALIRIAGATALGVGFAALMGWSLMGGLVFGLALSVSSTVVLLNALQDRHLVDSDRGRIAVGWLIVEDVAMVLALVLIPAFATQGGATHVPVDPFVALTEQVLNTHLGLVGVVGVTLVKLLAFVGFMVVVGRRIIPFILHSTAHTGSRELFRLAVLVIALGVAAGAAYLFGVSIALGAFFAGMILSESELSQRAAQETLPLRDAFGVLFFVSVGMLFDPSIIIRDPLPVLATLAIILFGKSIIGFLLLVLFRRPVATALTISAGLAQIGEFSFILAALGVGLGVLPPAGRDLILAGSIISIVLNPLMFWWAERLRPRLESRSGKRAESELGPVVPDTPEALAAAAAASSRDVLEEVAHPTRLSNHVILVGYGRVGSVVGGELLREDVPFVLVEDAEGRVLAAREAGIEVIVGNAATRTTLTLANVMGARCVVIAIPNAFEAGQATEQCRKLNQGIKIIARAHSEEEIDYLRHLGADEVIMGEREIGLGMIDWLKGETRRENTVAPKLAAGENLLQQARAAPAMAATVPAVTADVESAAMASPFAEPLVLHPVEEIYPPHPAEAPVPVDLAPAVVSVDAEPAPMVAEVPSLPTAPIVVAPPTLVAEPSAVVPTPLSPVTSEIVATDGLPTLGQIVDPFWKDDEPAVVAEDEAELFVAPLVVVPPPTSLLPEKSPWSASDDAPWMAALERDLFSGGQAAAASARELSELAVDPRPIPTPTEDPQPVPQPVETPQPVEDPQPAPQPLETPPPNEDPQPVPQPVETPRPVEIPATTASASDRIDVDATSGRVVPPVLPEPTADADGEVKPVPVDPIGRREPRLY
jgi:CPA2 family monovalent cation:H+ antiporter-2